MERWKNIHLSEEEEEGVTEAGDEVSGEEIFQKTLVGKLWNYARAFRSTMISASKLFFFVETHEQKQEYLLDSIQ